MKSSRTLTVILTLAALLFSNVAGWVHVGCSGHSGGCHSTACCGADSTECGRAEPRIACKTPSSEHAGHSEHSFGHSCCHHDHGDQQTDTLAHTESQADRADSEQPDETPVREHDSDRCSICQSFFASRHAVVIVDAVTLVELLTTDHEVVLADDVIASNHLSRSHTVRGPPSV